MLLHGYHPYVEDASIYVSCIEKAITPSLYLRDNAFVAEHTKVSAFAVVLARLQTLSGIPLDVLLALVYFALLFGFLLTCYQLGARIAGGGAAAFSGREPGSRRQAGGWGATLLMVAVLPIPVAATALLLIDPYLTARSFSSTLSLLAMLACVDNRWRLAGGCWLLTAIFHPQMAAYLAAFLLIYFLVYHRRARLIGAACALAVALYGVAFLLTRSTPTTASYREAILSRDFYFPTVWHWYELCGLLMPLLLMAWAWKKTGLHTVFGRLACTSLIVGATSCVCCFCFVHPQGPYLLARLQILRSFHMIYALGILMLGATIATRVTRPAASHRSGRGTERDADRDAGRGTVGLAALTCGLLAVVATGMFLMQRRTYRTLPDVELPGTRARNAWEEGFWWVRGNTPQDAYFAMDPRLLNFEDEATPGFRAIAERSILTDVKDEGVASLFPAVAPAWAANRRSEELLENPSDQQRLQQLRSLGVSWILLSSKTASDLACPYRNGVMEVCSLAPANSPGIAVVAGK